MKYFKNTELAKLYNVSEKSVRNWIDAAEKGKLELQLVEASDKRHIANTSHNTFLIEGLVAKGKKYRNSRGFKIITPQEEFYEYFDANEIFDILSNLNIHHEIPHKYSYFAEGAVAWDEYTRKSAHTQFPNSLKNTIELLEISQPYLELLLKDYTEVNVVDLGVGNGYPVKDLLHWLKEQDKLGRYVGIDASEDMLDINEKNLKQWLGNTVKFERHVADVGFDKFNEVLHPDSFSPNERPVLNLVLFLGGTIANLRDPDHALRTIYNSLGKDDLLIVSRKLDTPEARRFFDFSVAGMDGKLVKQDKVIFDLLGIDENLYIVEQFYDPELRQRIIQVRLKVDLQLKVTLEDKVRTIELHKDGTILVWRATHLCLLEVAEQFHQNGFEVKQLLKSKDKQYIQAIVNIKPIS